MQEMIPVHLHMHHPDAHTCESRLLSILHTTLLLYCMNDETNDEKVKVRAFWLEFYTFLGTAPLLHWCRQSGPNNCVHKGFDARERERERLGSPRGSKTIGPHSFVRFALVPTFV